MIETAEYNAICPERGKGCLDRFVAPEGAKLGGYIDVMRCPPCAGTGESENPALRAANRYSQTTNKTRKKHYARMGRIQR